MPDLGYTSGSQCRLTLFECNIGVWTPAIVNLDSGECAQANISCEPKLRQAYPAHQLGKDNLIS
jgi:hypothetical protein